LTSVTKDEINLKFDQLIDDGGSAISEFELYFSTNDGTSFSKIEAYNNNEKQFIINKTICGLTYGAFYIFKYAARNLHLDQNNNGKFELVTPANDNYLQEIYTFSNL